jgi:hypothetical protein
LTVRDATANNLAQVLNFGAKNLAAPQYAVPTGPFGSVCPGSTPDPGIDLLIQELLQLGFQIPL